MKSRVMVLAWVFAREGAARFGGSAKEYLSAAMTRAWAIVRRAERNGLTTIPGGPVYGSHFDPTKSRVLTFAIKPNVTYKSYIFGCNAMKVRRTRDGLFLPSHTAIALVGRIFRIEAGPHVYSYVVERNGLTLSSIDETTIINTPLRDCAF